MNFRTTCTFFTMLSIVFGLSFVTMVVGLLVNLQGDTSGRLNTLGWSSVARHGVLTRAWGLIASTGRSAERPASNFGLPSRDLHVARTD
jgi:hypothetical protein